MKLKKRDYVGPNAIFNLDRSILDTHTHAVSVYWDARNARIQGEHAIAKIYQSRFVALDREVSQLKKWKELI